MADERLLSIDEFLVKLIVTVMHGDRPILTFREDEPPTNAIGKRA